MGEQFSVVASEQPRCASVGRAIEAYQHPAPSSTVIQCSVGGLSVPNESLIIKCASLSAFCNEFQVKMYDIITASFSEPPDLRPDHQILRAGGPVVHCLKC